MKKKIMFCFFMMAGFVLSFLSVRQALAAGDHSLTEVKPLKMTRVSEDEYAELAGKGAAASGKKGFVKEFQKHAVKREKTFQITYSGNVNDIPSDSIIEEISELDNKKTSDDADFLSGGILDLGWSGYYTSSSQLVLNCKLTYTENAGQVKKLNQKAKQTLKKLNLSGMSDVAKVKVIHDYVVKKVTYDHSLKDHSAYGGLVASKHSTVCQGYALIMYKLLTDAGVPVHYVTGNAGGPHAWNIVKIKGKWYHLDATWDDPSNAVSYAYFLTGSKKMNKDHRLDSYYKRKYAIASGNLNWKKLIRNSGKKKDEKAGTSQSKKDRDKAASANLREEVIRLMSSAIDEALKSDSDPTDYEVQMYDLCKKIYGFIIEDMSEEAFVSFLDSDEMMDTYINDTMAYIEEYILDPMIAYIDSSDFTDAIYEQMYSDFGREAFEQMSEKEMEGIIEAYAYDLFTELLYEQSEQYTDLIVSEMVQKLEGMAG